MTSPTRMAFVSWLGARAALFDPSMTVWITWRGLVLVLKPKHQLDQIVLAQPLQIIAIHPNLKSATRPTPMGWGITRELTHNYSQTDSEARTS